MICSYLVIPRLTFSFSAVQFSGALGVFCPVIKNQILGVGQMASYLSQNTLVYRGVHGGLDDWKQFRLCGYKQA